MAFLPRLLFSSLVACPMCSWAFDAWITNGINVACDQFGFDGNRYRESPAGAIIVSDDASGGSFVTDRYRILSGAIRGRLIIPDASSLFPGSYIVNGGYDLDDVHYGRKSESSECVAKMTDHGTQYFIRTTTTYYPKAVAATSDSQLAATYMFCFKLDHLPSTDTILFEREQEYGADRNRYLNIHVTADGCIGVTYSISSSSSESRTSTAVVSAGRWHCLSISCVGNYSFLVYLDGVVVGSYSSAVTLGYLPQVVDKRYYQVVSRTGRLYGTIMPSAPVLTVGADDVDIDDLLVYRRALTASEIQSVYAGFCSYL